MNLKRLLLILLPLSLLINFSNAQGLYAGLLGGYGFTAAGTSDYGEDQTTSITSAGYSVQHTARKISFGTGSNYGLYAGYFFSPHVGLEIEYTYIKGHMYTLHTETDDNTSSSKTSQDDTWKGTMNRLTPCLRFQVGDNRAKAYMKTGLILGMGTSVMHEATSTFSAPSITTTTDDAWEYSGGFTMGFRGAFGVNVKVNEMFQVFGEMSFNYMNWAPQKMIHTKSISNGKDILASQTASQAETDFLSSYQDGGLINVNSYTQANQIYMPFSSIGFNFGVQIFLERKKSAPTTNP